VTHYADLSAYEYTDPPEDGDRHLNIGWLDAEHPFTKGVLGDEALERLDNLRSSPVNLFRGSHACDFCLAELRTQLPETGTALISALRDTGALGNGEIVVKGAEAWYHAPVLITHYIRRHGYLPPQEFVDAVLATGA
jgi:hypothetical protein